MSKKEIEKKMVKENILAEYDDKKSLNDSFLSRMETLIKILIEQEKIKISSISSRIKEKESLSNKLDIKQKYISDELNNKQENLDLNKFKYNDLSDFTDICGIRICTFYSDDVDKIADIIEKEFTVDRENTIDKRATMEYDKFGYLSLHYIVSLPETRLTFTENILFENLKFEIQIRSVLQHTWAEIEHDLGYKSAEGLPKPIKRDFSRLAGLLELADKEFLSIRNYLSDYKDNVNKNIQIPLKYEEFLIDRITLKEFVKSEFFVNHLKFIADETGEPIIYLMNDRNIDTLTTAFDFLKILTIFDLKQLLEESKYLMINSIIESYINKNEQGSVSLVDIGTLYYSLYYKILKDNMPKETLKDIFYILNVGANYEEDYAILSDTYHSL